MIEPHIVKPIVQHLIRGAFGMVVDEVRGSLQRKNGPVMPTPAELSDEVNFAELGSLDDVRLGGSLAPGPGYEEVVPADLFGCVVGLEYECRVLRRCVVSGTPPLHALLIGPPASAKSLLLEELRRLPETRYIVGRNMTSAGLLDLFVENDSPPRILLIDEIEKSDPSTLATLLTVMDGKATRAVHGKPPVEHEVDVRIIAAGNSSKGMPQALLSRFWELELADYTPEERRAVISGFLATRRGMDADQAQEIADLVAPRGGDTRDADQIAGVWLDGHRDLAREMAATLNRAAPGPHQDRTGTAPAPSTESGAAA